MKRSTLITHNGLEISCLIVFEGKQLPFTGTKQEVLVYAQHRLAKAILENDYCAELETICEWCIIPDLEEELYDTLHS